MPKIKNNNLRKCKKAITKRIQIKRQDHLSKQRPNSVKSKIKHINDQIQSADKTSLNKNYRYLLFRQFTIFQFIVYYHHYYNGVYTH